MHLSYVSLLYVYSEYTRGCLNNGEVCKDWFFSILVLLTRLCFKKNLPHLASLWQGGSVIHEPFLLLLAYSIYTIISLQSMGHLGLQ